MGKKKISGVIEASTSKSQAGFQIIYLELCIIKGMGRS